MDQSAASLSPAAVAAVADLVATWSIASLVALWMTPGVMKQTYSLVDTNETLPPPTLLYRELDIAG